MQCKILLDENCEQPCVIIRTARVTPEIEILKKQIENSRPSLQGYRDGQLYLLPQADVIRVYSEKQRVWTETEQGVFLLRGRLYEAEALLDKTIFIRISSSEIVNSRCIQKLDVSLTGTIGVYLDCGIRTYASRRYVTRIKEFFGLRKGGTT